MDVKISRRNGLQGEIEVSQDKSISHRALILAALACGESTINNILRAEDIFSTCACLGQLGVDIRHSGKNLVVVGKGWEGLRKADDVLDCGNSGTTMRLLAGLLAGRPFLSILTGDASLRNRPMQRIVEPLTRMGAAISARQNNLAPLMIKGGPLAGIEYRLPVASAQLKSALLLAGLQAEGKTVIHEPDLSRDHSERMLSAMGADIRSAEKTVTLVPGHSLQPQQFLIPGDISSAAFFMVAATIVPGSQLLIRDVGINPTRAGIIEVLTSMGASISMENTRILGGEPVSDLLIRSAPLRAITVKGGIIPRLLDEIPILAVAMAVAEGESRIEDAGELRLKESDRLTVICSQLNKMGASLQELPDGLQISGRPGRLQGAVVESFADHRIAMSLAVAALLSEGETVISGAEAVDISFPNFWSILQS